MIKNTLIFILLSLFTHLQLPANDLVVSDNLSEVATDTLFHFTVLSDLHMHQASDTYVYEDFKKYSLPAIKNTTRGVGNFMISCGDDDSFTKIRKVVIDSLGKDFRFYTAVGNHDVGGTNNHYKEYPAYNWCDAFNIILYNKDSLKNVVNWGPETYSKGLDDVTYEKDGITYVSNYDRDGIYGSKFTTYSFDENNCHYVVIDMYSGYENSFTPGDGQITDTLYNWIKADLEATDKENIFVIGHEPISSTSKTWDLFKQNNVIAYFSGHTHVYKTENIGGVWSLNPSSTSTSGDHYFFKVYVQGGNVELKSYKHISGTTFELSESVMLKGEGPVDDPCFEDDTPPSLSLGSANVYLDSTGVGVLKPRDLVKDTKDECGVVDTVLSDSVFGKNDIGLQWIRVTVRDKSGNSTTKTTNIHVYDTLSTSISIKEEEILEIYPNPAQEFLNIKLKENGVVDLVTIYDLSGNKVYSKIVGVDALKVDIDSLPSGIYLVKLSIGRKTYVRQFVKQ